MSFSSSTNRSSPSDALDAAPLLASNDDRARRFLRRQSFRGAARFLRRASSRSMMREPSMLVREAAAEQLEEQQSDWGYSKPVVVLDMGWNLAFVVVTAGVLMRSWYESPPVPLRLWIVGYALQCALHILCVSVEYRRRRRRSVPAEGAGSSQMFNSPLQVNGSENSSSNVVKHLESANTMFSFVWWIVGFYWVSVGGPALARESPQLYWFSIIFLAFDVFFVVFCIALACVIGVAVCCCLPCIIAVLYAVGDQEGASTEDVEQLSKYKYRRVGVVNGLTSEAQGVLGGVMTECGTDSPIERTLMPEDAECCICLSTYDDGAELRELPCGHHFHCTCVDKWLYINATCPLCKYDISRSGDDGMEEV